MLAHRIHVGHQHAVTATNAVNGVGKVLANRRRLHAGAKDDLQGKGVQERQGQEVGHEGVVVQDAPQPQAHTVLDHKAVLSGGIRVGGQQHHVQQAPLCTHRQDA